MSKIQQKALTKVLDGGNFSEFYFRGAYKTLFQKIKLFQKNKGSLPSVSFLQKSLKKLSKDKTERVEIEGILDAIEQIEDEEHSPAELSELLLEDYKEDTGRSLARELIEAQTENDWEAVAELSNKISKTAMQSNNSRFLEKDIRHDITETDVMQERIYTGLFKNESVSSQPRGSLITILGGSGHGKSTLTLQANVEAFFSGLSVLNLNYELPKKTVLNRVRAYIAEVPEDEISKKSFTTEEARLRVKASDIVLRKDIKLKDVVERLVKDEADSFADIPDRKNKFKIVAAPDRDITLKAMERGEPIEELPNDNEILSLVREYGVEFDIISIDLISEVDFHDKRASREQNITNFVRRFKQELLMSGAIGMIVSQVQSNKNVSGMFRPKYSEGVYSSSDSVIAIAGTREMIKEELVAICTEKNRHGKPKEALICERNFSIMRFTYVGEKESLDDLQEEIGKELRKESQ